MSFNSLAASKSSARVGRTTSLTKDTQNDLLKSFSVLVSAIDDDASDTSSSSVEEHAAASDFEASTSTRNFSNKPKRGALHVGELVKHKTAIAQAQKDQQDKKAPIESTAAKTIDRLTAELNQTKKHLDETEEELHTTRETNRKLKRMTGELEDDLSAARSETEALRRLMNMSNASPMASPAPTGQKASLIKKKALAAIEWSEGYNRDTILAFESELRSTAVSYYATRFNSIVRVQQRLQSQGDGGGSSSNPHSSPLIAAAGGKDIINGSTTTVTSDGTEYHLPNEAFPVPEAAPEFDMPSISPRALNPAPARKPGIWWPTGVPNTHYRDPKFIEVPSKGRARSKPPLTQDRSESSISPPPPSARQHRPYDGGITSTTPGGDGRGVSTSYSPIRQSSTSAPRPATSSSPRNTPLNATLLRPTSSSATLHPTMRNPHSGEHHGRDVFGNTVGSPSPRKVRSSQQPSQRETASAMSQRLGSGNPLPRAISPAALPQRRKVTPPPSEVTIVAAPTATTSDTPPPEHVDDDGIYFKEVKQIRVSQRYPLRSSSAGGGASNNASRRGSVSSVLHVVTEKGVRCASVPCFSRTESPAADHYFNQIGGGGRSASQQSHQTTASGPPPVVFDYLSRAHVLDEDALIRHQRQLLNIKPRRPSDFNSTPPVPVAVSATRPRASSAGDAQPRFNLSPSLVPLRQQEIGGVVRVSSNYGASGGGSNIHQHNIAVGLSSGDGGGGGDGVVRRSSSHTTPAGVFQQVSSARCSLKLDPPSHSHRPQ